MIRYHVLRLYGFDEVAIYVNIYAFYGTQFGADQNTSVCLAPVT